MSLRTRQRGVALLTVLLLVAAMSTLVIAVLDDIRFGLRRADNAQSIAQAQWYALGAETLAAAQLARLSARTPARTTLQGGWNGRPFVFPIENGSISARVSDGTACFNLNGVVAGAGDLRQANEAAVAQYVALLQAIDFAERDARGLADALVDWIDTDQVRRPYGDEDDAYARGRDGYRTSSALLAEVSELRAIRGYTPAAYARLRPYVCALPLAMPTPVNINTLGERDAPILDMLTEGRLGIDGARAVIASRPAAGWSDVAAFAAQPAFAEAALSPAAIDQVALRTRFFRLHAEVEYGIAQVALSALLEQDVDGRTRVVARRWTPEE